ncbi:MAG: hypothetical protein V4687_07850 [Bacteroidota bacterium]
MNIHPGKLKYMMQTLNDETINELAVDWYFLNMQVNSSESVTGDDVFNELIEAGLMMKQYLKIGNFTLEQPMNVYVEGDTYFDIWLDSNNQILASSLYNEEY